MFPAPVSEDALDEIVFKIKQKFANKPKVAVIGVGRASKSSLHEAIYRKKDAKDRSFS